MTCLQRVKSDLPELAQIAEEVTDYWPEHARFLETSLASLDSRQLQSANRLSRLVGRTFDGRLAKLASDYRWTCERLLEEELHFRRAGAYRHTRFADAKAEVYDNAGFMARYVNGLLLSQVLWANHAKSFDLYLHDFLSQSPKDYRHLEIGPGHGAWLYFAAEDPDCTEAVGWDISDSSLEAARRTLAHLEDRNDCCRLEARDIMQPADLYPGFDNVVVSEVLEHLEAPDRALRNLHSVIRPGGQIFVGMPVNSPAPDHIFHLETPEQVVDLVRQQGFTVTRVEAFPAAGYSEARARKARTTISCAVIAERCW